MITPSQSLRKVSGRRSKTSCAMASISSREGALVSVHMDFSLEHDGEKWEPVFNASPCRFDRERRLTSGGQSETLQPYEQDLGGRDEVDCDSRTVRGFRGWLAAVGKCAGTDGGARRARCAGRSRLRAAAAKAAPRASLSARALRSRRLSALQPRSECRARMQRLLCAGG